MSVAGIVSLCSIAGAFNEGKMWTIKGSLKPGPLFVLFRAYPGAPVKLPDLGSITSISSTHECAVVEVARANATRAVAAVRILMRGSFGTESVGLRFEAG